MTKPDPPKAGGVVFGITRKSLEGMVIRACPHCEAPGTYKDDVRTIENWPGCFSNEKAGQLVGDICPNCNKKRKPNEHRGELTASMPLWIWYCILAAKWCVVSFKNLTT
jgi:hypothetical protein